MVVFKVIAAVSAAGVVPVAVVGAEAAGASRPRRRRSRRSEYEDEDQKNYCYHHDANTAPDVVCVATMNAAKKRKI